MNMDQMINDFNSMEELRAFATSQFRTILEQSKKISTLEAEVEHLKELLESNSPILAPTDSNTLAIVQEMSDEEAIATLELKKLKEISLRQELSTEEAKKYAIYTKALQEIRGNAKRQDDPVGKMDNEQLAKFAESLGSDITLN
jgi:RIO-like serine/threonine protein kinase